MKRIKVFVASAGSLQEERSSLELFLSRENDHLVNQGIYLQTVIWEKASLSFSIDRKQNDFNELLLDSDIFICLIFDKVGKFTREEFEVAYNSFKKNGTPKKIYVYFKNADLKTGSINDNFLEVLKLKEEIKKYEQVYGQYENVADLWMQIKYHLDNDVKHFNREDIGKSWDNLLDKINPNINRQFAAGAKIVCAMVDQSNIPEFLRLKELIENKGNIRVQSNGNTIMGGSGNRIGNCLNDVNGDGGYMRGFNILKIR